ncbi:uncharacterized protein CCOS01_08984 [Colletotrichum costaricense]|uniref:Enoyl reductase (ER) domain-containing protein n=1 Tax=Colletotrichum costaricense TaxID=1209916 RepID=A0AAI9YUI8_9PEZI|nr:uncharacterized protein CCOS01_08984 [Colletotrichum costaricense]KAK1523897.1 hypothetical protein CCOS01_08984 [Colletotrichum costaricense]
MSFSHTGDVPPPPPRPLVEKARTPAPAPPPPTVPPTGSPGAFLVELLIFNGSPFKDHWAYFVRSRADDDIGVKIHATGDVRNGFKFEVKRSHDLTNTSDIPTKRVSLQWVDAQHFKADAMLNWGVEEIDERPVCGFEASAYKAKAPGKTLNAVEDKDQSVAVQDIPAPEPGPREILVRVRAVALNHVDALYTNKPIAAQEYRVVGSDFAGEVASVGTDIQNIDDPRVKIGTHVAGFVQGGQLNNPGPFAEYVVIDYDLTWNIPIEMSFQEAATVSLCGLTAAQGVFSRLELPGPFTQPRSFDHLRLANEEPVNVFIYGATTSLGLFAAQLVRLAEKTFGTQIRLIGAASSAKHGMLRQAPYLYDELVDYRDADWQESVRKVCGISGGVHYGIDAVSQSPSVERVHDTLVNEGKLAVFRAPALAGFDPSKLSIKPVTGAVWEGLGVEIQYQGITFPANLEAREFATQFYNYLGSEASLGKVKLQANPVRMMRGGLENIASEGIPLFGPKQVNEPPKDHMRPVSGEKVVYTVS